MAAAGPAARESGKFVPVATYVTETPGAKTDWLMAAAVA
jgi:hypothetical protein